ncbi:MAG: 2'-5' RNA ligase family protein [Bacteroidales bacterium]|jgi:2'-5' RNA ligase|nr:2'-5' RNA ligase family protein [Bacteroidales bacterium]MCU0410547.1 2'-5' RNA ligase family protein [Bacteroidales bacterium]
MKGGNEQGLALYFIALIPHKELRDEIRAIKERMRDRYGAGHALKSPAHVTLQKPFKRSIKAEEAISEALREFALKEKPFTVDLDGFGAFAPRVIYVRIRDHRPVIQLHSRLKEMLITKLMFLPGEVMDDVQPHITVATRDLTKKAFSEAWPEIQNERIISSFNVNRITLLRHTGIMWEILNDYYFSEMDEAK